MLLELSVFYGFFQGLGIGPRPAVFCDSTSHSQASNREGSLIHSILRAGKHPRLKGSLFHGPPLILDVTRLLGTSSTLPERYQTRGGGRVRWAGSLCVDGPGRLAWLLPSLPLALGVHRLLEVTARPWQEF